MKDANDNVFLSEEIITNKIYLIRGEKVMLDRDLAELYGVETKYLKRQVRRNQLRFPDDFMFELSQEEFQNWRSQFGTSNQDKNIELVFRYLDELIEKQEQPNERRKIGYKR